MAALLENSFAFLDGEEDGAKIIEAAKAVAQKEAEEKRQILKQQQSEQAVKARRRSQQAPGSMRAKRIILPRHNIVVRKGNPDGAEQNDAGRNSSGGNGDSGSYKGAAIYEGNNYRRDGNEYRGTYGGRGGYRGNNRRRNNNLRHNGSSGNNNSGYNGNSNGSRDGDYYRSNGGNNVNRVGENNSGGSLGVDDNDGWQISGWRRRRGQNRGYNSGLAFEGQVAAANQIQGQDRTILGKSTDGQVIEKKPISEKEFSGVQHSHGEKKSIVAGKDLDGDITAAAINGAEEDVADTTTDGSEKSKKKKPQIQLNTLKNYSKKMTLGEYDKVRSEKWKALESLNKVEQRQVALDKDFESMQLVGKKSQDDDLIKPNTKKELLQRKDGINNEEKARKSMSINEFLKPVEVETSEMSCRQRKLPYEKYWAGNSSNPPERDQGRGRGFDGVQKINGERQHQRPYGGREFVGERITGGHRQERPYNGHGYEGTRTNDGPQHQRSSYNGGGRGHRDDRKQNGSNGGGEIGKPNNSRHERPSVLHRDGYTAPARNFNDCEPQHERPYKNGLEKGKELNVEDPNQFPALGGGTKGQLL